MKKLIVSLMLLLSQESFASFDKFPHCTQPMVEFPYVHVCTYNLEEDLYLSLVRDMNHSARFGTEDYSVLTQSFYQDLEQTEKFHADAEDFAVQRFKRYRIMEGFPLKLPQLKGFKESETRKAEKK